MIIYLSKSINMMNFIKKTLFLICLSLAFLSCKNEYSIESGDCKLMVDNQMRTSISFINSPNSIVNAYNYSEIIETDNGIIKDFKIGDTDRKSFTNEIGKGEILTIKGNTNVSTGKLEKILQLTKYESFPEMILTKVFYVNKSQSEINVLGWKNNAFEVVGMDDKPKFWSFQGESTMYRRDWIQPVDSAFTQQNFMGMNNSDYGGGIPVTCLWRSDMGIAVGHVSLNPELVSLPVKKSKYENNAKIGIEQKYSAMKVLLKGDTLSTLQTFVQLYKGDCFVPLRKFSEFMQKSGIKMPESEPAAFEPMWCSWGYERNATFEEILGTLPKVKELGIKWATIDDGFQIAEGDWDLDPKRFPGGDKEMTALVGKIKAAGLKVQLWWAPLAADPGTNLLKNNPDLLMLAENGAPYHISWWDSYYISPVHQKTIDESNKLVSRFLSTYGFEGLKLDGQHLNSVHPDYNPKHHADKPELAFENLPSYFKSIFETSLNINPHAVIQLCPCGCCMSFFNMPFTNQVVASDPLNSWQIRSKGFVYKAIIPKTAYFGDHVEMSDNGNDFASSFGIGAVPGTKFTYPKNNPTVKEDYLLTPEKEKVWKQWFALYNEKMLSTGEYIGGLYDIGYDVPETHVIRKNNTLYYAFYTKSWNGDIHFKGLDASKSYMIFDYINLKELGKIQGNNPVLNCQFKNNLLVQANKIK